MLSIGLPNDEDNQGEEPPCCSKCKHELAFCEWDGWWCDVCGAEPEDKE